MRHLRSGKQLGRNAKNRKALFRSLVTSLVEHGKIKTTLAKAKVLRPYVERTITRARKNDLNTIRILRKDFSEKTTSDLTKKWGVLFKTRNGGYTRIIKLPFRSSDASPMAYIEFVEKPEEKKADKQEKNETVKAKVEKKEKEVSEKKVVDKEKTEK